MNKSFTGFRGALGTADIYVNGGIYQPSCSGWINYVTSIGTEAFVCENINIDNNQTFGDKIGELGTNLFYNRHDSNVCAHSYAHKYFGDVFHIGKEDQLVGLSCEGSSADPVDQVLKSNCHYDAAHAQTQFLKYVPFMFKLRIEFHFYVKP